MKIIAHRANLVGPDMESENTIDAISDCFERGFDVELDVWQLGNELFLSHHYPHEPAVIVPRALLGDDRIWWHAKNTDAFVSLQNLVTHLFWHQNDDFALTTSGYLWTFPGCYLTDKSIQVLPEVSLQRVPDFVYGVCTDFPTRFGGQI